MILLSDWKLGINIYIYIQSIRVVPAGSGPTGLTSQLTMTFVFVQREPRPEVLILESTHLIILIIKIIEKHPYYTCVQHRILEGLISLKIITCLFFFFTVRPYIYLKIIFLYIYLFYSVIHMSSN